MANPLHIFSAGATHHSATLAQREKLAAVPGAKLAAWLESQHAEGRLAEFTLIATCNRIECFGVAADPDLAAAFNRMLAEEAGLRPDETSSCLGVRLHEAACIHLFEVASSLDSQLVGETEILGQVKEAYAKAESSRSLGPVLHRLFQKAFQCAKWIRSHSSIGRGTVSVGSVAGDLACEIFGDLRSAAALVLGAGEVGEKTAKALLSRGLNTLTIINRSPATAEKLAAELGARHAPWERLDEELRGVDIVLACTSAPMPVLTSDRVFAAMHRRRGRPLFLIDLALPRDVEPRASLIPEVFLYNLDDLAAIAENNRRAREAEVGTCRSEVQRRALSTWQDLVSRSAVHASADRGGVSGNLAQAV